MSAGHSEIKLKMAGMVLTLQLNFKILLSLWLLVLLFLHTSPEAISGAEQCISWRILTPDPEVFSITLTGWLCSGAQWSQWVLGLWLMMPMAGWIYWQSPALTAKQSASRVPGLTVCVFVCTRVCVHLTQSTDFQFPKRSVRRCRVILTPKPPLLDLGCGEGVVCQGKRPLSLVLRTCDNDGSRGKAGNIDRFRFPPYFKCSYKCCYLFLEHIAIILSW